MLNMNEVRRIVVKVGSSTLTYDNGTPNIRRIERLVRTISDLQNRGFEMVLVSSGAVAVGTAKLGLAERPKELTVKQAAAAVGQCELMHIYDKMFLEYGINVAQIPEEVQNTKIAMGAAGFDHIVAFGENGKVKVVPWRMQKQPALRYLLPTRETYSQ